MRARQRTIAATAVACLALAASLTGCGDGRSVQAFCQTYRNEKAKFLTRYAPLSQPIASNDPHAGSKVLLDVVMAVQSLGDAKVILTKLDNVAPPAIQPDMDAVLESWKSTQDTLGSEASHVFDPKAMFGDMLKGIFMSVQSNGSWQRVGDYISTNCGA